MRFRLDFLVCLKSLIRMTQFTATEERTGKLTKAVAGYPRVARWSFARNIAILGGGTALAQSFNVLLAPLLTRLYLPDSLGQFALFASFLNVAMVGISLRYELGIVAARTEQKAAQLALLAFLFSLPVSIFGAGALFLAIHFSLLGFNTLPSYTPLLMVPALVFVAAFSALRYWFVRQEQFRGVSQATVVQNGARSISQVVMGVFGGRLAGLLAGELIGRSAGMTRMFREAWPSIRAYVFPANPRNLSEVLWENRQFPVYSLPSSLVDTLAANICIPLVVRCFGVETGGYFALVQRVLAVPLVLISTSVADAFHGRLAQYVRETPERVVGLFQTTSAVLALLGILPTILLMLFGRPLFKMVFGSRWTLAGDFAAVAAPLFLAQFVVTPLSRLVFVLEGQRLKLVYDLLALTTTIGVFVFSAWGQLSPVQTIMVLSATGTLTFGAYYLVLTRIVSKHHHSLGNL